MSTNKTNNKIKEVTEPISEMYQDAESYKYPVENY